MNTFGKTLDCENAWLIDEPERTRLIINSISDLRHLFVNVSLAI